MEVILYMAISVDGYIAKKDGETPWSDEEWKSFSKKVEEIGNIVIGWNTYNVMKKGKEFKEIGDPLTIVVTSKKQENKEKVMFVDSPESALEVLKEKGFSKTLIAGGSILNSSFMKKGLVNEMFLDVEPFVFGSGIPLFSENNFDVALELLGSKKISKNTIQLHYKVL